MLRLDRFRAGWGQYVQVDRLGARCGGRSPYPSGGDAGIQAVENGVRRGNRDGDWWRALVDGLGSGRT